MKIKESLNYFTEKLNLIKVNDFILNVFEILKSKLTKKQAIICGVAFVSIIIILIVLLSGSKFEKVENEVVKIAGRVASGKNYFTIDTYPDSYENMDKTLVSILRSGTEDNALEAIRYANKELGFNGAVYSKMKKTSSLMGRQSEENDKYVVSWTYHPDDGLEVTYEKK